MKKIGILTLGLKDNYGGILQCICLYTYLKREGYYPVLIRKYPKETFLRKFLIKVLEITPCQNIKGLRLIRKKYSNNLKFWSNYIDQQSQVFYTKKQISKFINDQKIDTVIVGSDQVWRYKYINDGEYDTYFLNLEIPSDVKKISYAASFGGASWEAPELNVDISKFLSKFTAVSVREYDGINICNKQFNYANAECVLDPTLLMDTKFYEDIIKDVPIEKFECIEYILDKTEFKSNVISKIKENHKFSKTLKLLGGTKIYSIPEWVAAFKNTDFVITDSFHGMVFSIIFNKQFLVLVNEGRGKSRFESLCKMLGLEDRLIYENNISEYRFSEINYNEVNKLLHNIRNRSKNFLNTNLY